MWLWPSSSVISIRIIQDVYKRQVENPVAYMILNQEGAVFKNDADEKHMRELLADGNGASMGV